MATKPVLFVLREGDPARRARIERRCLDAAARRGLAARLVEWTHDAADWRAHVVGEVRAGIAAGAGLVVAVGGDGTIGAAAEGVLGSDAVLAAVPRGAANLFARALAIPAGFSAALAVAFSGAERTVDVGRADGRAVVTMASIGVDAAVVAATSSAAKHGLGWLGYGLATLAHLDFPLRRFSIALDEASPVSVEARSVVVANVGRLPAGFALSTQARPDDGVLDVALLAPAGALGWAVMLGGMARAGWSARGEHGCTWRQARTVAITADEVLARQLDGEPIAPARTLEVRVATAALTVRVPRR